MWDPYAEFQTASLPNGLTVHAAHWPGRPWEAMGFMIHSGASQDPEGLEGVAHFVEHLVSVNTILPAKDIYAFFGNCGGNVDLGATRYPNAYYKMFVPIEKDILSRAFSIFGHMLLSAKLEKFIERERQVITGEFHRRYPAKFKLDLELRKYKMLYPGYRPERFTTPLGRPESIEAISQNDLQSYYDQHYTPTNISIVGVGGMQLAELVELLSNSPFAQKKEGERTPRQVPVNEVEPPLETLYILQTPEQPSMQLDVGAFQSWARLPGNINTAVLAIIRRMLTHILMEEVREQRAWVYDISSNWGNVGGFREISISCQALALKAIDEIEEVIEICIASVADREDLFEEVKGRMISANLMIDHSGQGIRDGALDNLGDHQKILPVREWNEEVEGVKMEEICSLLKWLKPERRWAIITRP